MVVLLLWLIAWQSPATTDGPRSDEFARRIREALRLDHETQKHFTYLERRRDVKISRLGKVTIGPLRTFEVYPGDGSTSTFKRLIEIDGKPLTPDELARREAERQRDLAREKDRDRTETTGQRAERLQAAEQEHKHRLAMLEDAKAVFRATFVGRDTIEDRPVLVAELKPRSDAAVKTREGGWMKHFEGRIWVDEVTYEVVKLDVRAFEDVTVGWGIVGRLHKGSRLLYSRRQFEGVWLPAEMTYQASGRTLLFRTFEFAVTTTYRNYKRR